MQGLPLKLETRFEFSICVIACNPIFDCNFVNFTWIHNSKQPPAIHG